MESGWWGSEDRPTWIDQRALPSLVLALLLPIPGRASHGFGVHPPRCGGCWTLARMAVSPPSASDCRGELLHLLRDRGHAGSVAEAPRVRELLQRLERLQPANLLVDSDRLSGVWELRWSSGNQPYLAVAPWLQNLQLLDPRRGRAMNLLRLAGPIAPLAGIAVQAKITVEGAQRVGVRFVKGGWLGPRIAERRLQLLRAVNQSFPAWLDITVLDDDLRVCRGNAGTLFALVRRPELRVQDFFATDPDGAAPPPV